MSLDLTGKLQAIYQTQEVGEKKFKTREFVLELSEEINGNVYTNYAKMQLVQAKCDIINPFQVGHKVKVSFNVRGRAYTDKKDGSTKYMTTLNAWKIELAAGSQQPQQQQANPQNYASSSPASQYGNNYNTAPNFNPSPEAIDDLPF